jgi:hypothetical protein
MPFNILNPTRPQTDEQVKEIIIDLVGEDNNIAIPNGYSESFIGTYYDPDTEEYRAVYSRQRMIETVMTEDSCSYEDAVDWLELNCWNTGLGEWSEPLFIDTK